MIYDNDRAVSRLNALIETCKDGENGFRCAARAVQHHSELQLLFHAYAQERADCAAELQAEVRRLGGRPETRGSLSGAIHRGWIDITSALTGGDEHAMLSACESGEHFATQAYERALEDTMLPTESRAIVKRQRAQIRSAQDKIRALRMASRERSAAVRR